jgi:hypothetical protein
MEYPGDPEELDFVQFERFRRRYDYLREWGNRTPAEARAEAIRFAKAIDERPPLEVAIDRWDVPSARTFPWWVA